MKTNKINCPNCGFEIDVNKILSHQIEDHLRNEFKKTLEERDIKAQEKEIKIKQETEIILRKQIAEENKVKDSQMKKKLDELAKLKAETEKLKKGNEESERKIKADYEARFKKMMAAETEKIKKESESDYERIIKEKDITIKSLNKLATEAKRKAEQGSIQLQGEAQEVCIEEWLRKMYPDDLILEVRKGDRGGDCIHTVMQSGEQAAKIFYESKRTKLFQRGWIEKLKQDMIREKANVGIIITETMPVGAKDIIQIDGIWVCSYQSSKSLCMVIREFVLKTYGTFKVNNGKKEKMELLYDYLTGDEFRMNVETMFKKLAEMKIQIEKEKKDAVSSWKKREEHISSMIKSAAGICVGVKQLTGNEIVKLNEQPYLLTD